MVKAMGTFVRREGYIFRTDAELIFQDGREKNALLIMMNPGASRLENEGRWDSFVKAGDSVTGELKLDQTMEQICAIVTQAHPNFNGRVKISNLFNVRCGNMKLALKLYLLLKSNSDMKPFLETDYNNLLTTANSYSCIWLGWSLESGSAALNGRKKEVFQQVQQVTTVLVAKHKNDDSNSYHVWHVKPQMKCQAEEYKSFIVPRLAEVLC